MAPRMIATEKFCLATPSAWRDATRDTADIGGLDPTTVALLHGHDALGERRGLIDVRARHQRRRSRGWSAGGWSDGDATPRQEFQPC
jgi:hypothetical protein